MGSRGCSRQRQQPKQSREAAKHGGLNKQDASVLRIAHSPWGRSRCREDSFQTRPGKLGKELLFTAGIQASPNDSEFLGWAPRNLSPGDPEARHPVWEPAIGNKESVTF